MPPKTAQNPVTRTLLRKVAALIQGGSPPRVARVVLGRPAGFDIAKTTVGLDKEGQAQRAQRIADSMAFDRTRRARYTDYREMNAEVPELHRALMVLVDFTFGGKLDDGGQRQSFEIDTSKARPEVAKVIEDTTDALDLQSTIRDIFREGLQLGDSFTQFVYTPNAMVGQVALLPESVDPIEVMGFVEKYKISGQGGSSRDLARYEVLHYAPDRPRGARFGQALWASARKRWRIADSAEDVLSLMTLIEPRGKRRVFWPFPAEGGASSDSKIWEWIRQVQAQTEEDYFFDADGKLQKSVVPQLETSDRMFPFKVWADGMENAKPFVVESPPANLEQLITVLRFFQDSYFIATGVPAALCGYEANVNARSTVEQQGVHFALTVRNRQGQVSALLQETYIRALLAAGIVPERGEVVIVMPPPSNFDQEVKARVLQARAQAASQLAPTGAPTRFILQHALDLTDEEVDRALQGMNEPAQDPDQTDIVQEARRQQSQYAVITRKINEVYAELGAVRADIARAL